MSAPESTAAMPSMMYGTAWKKDRTADLVYEAIKAGFRGIDTAAMKKHYDEALTGEGIRRAIREGIVSRRELFIQTKFTPLDSSSPYSQTDPIPAQIHASVTSSLTNLATPDHPQPYLDALILHSPFPTAAETLEAFHALQSYLPNSPDPSRAGKILRLGISNITPAQLHALTSTSTTPSPSSPAPPPITIIQNRLRAAEHAWDRSTRAWCAARGAAYQGFWTLTGNAGVWQQRGGGAAACVGVGAVADGAGVSRAAAWYVLLMEAGVVVLNGTCDAAHMREDLDARGRVERWRRGGEEGARVWEEAWREFEALVGGVAKQG
ncbi:e30f746d-fc37-4ac4-b4a3-387fe712744d [Thermothielavioides terrestris]|uniref:NADP-dependent oxidoreductase domain-containing protein n=2 Tax=Thermothielavioides terrestris TaxID=2587410 RepID=G2RFT8_THETT|nr:uncharacterized protein THITE_2124424 [Thermothielavioides terrestris NRRL 8126]AEO71692.1 hypothetical protein THITE_2124424 [Thermothielavioides terrestris NRRL 8126]SPQ27323.1 e30f746d-fc37-4ac4-b4a3-387fe712744d [Thermothielavioides terrestris]